MTTDQLIHRTCPLVVACGIGRDSVGALVGMHKLSIRPDLILFANVGSEKQPTYDYYFYLNDWLRSIGWPTLTVVRYIPQNFKHWPHYFSLEENLLTNSTLPSIAYGSHSCSSKWKIGPQNRFLDEWLPARLAWGRGDKLIKAIGFDASPHELGRSKGCSTYAVQDEETEKAELWFPLQQWGWNLERCIAEIKSYGLQVPMKSSCYFCTAMKPWEVDELPEFELKKIVVIEQRASKRNLDYAEKRALEKGLVWDGKPLTEGLWRKRVKGMRGATPKPGSMTEYIREKGLLPSAEIDRLISVTPTGPILRGEIDNWQVWLQQICYPQQLAA